MNTKMTQSAETRRTLHTHTHTHTCNLLLSIKQIGTICFAIFSFIFPSFGYVENNDPCTNDTLTVQSGSASLVANWQGNPISLNWYETSESVNPMSVATASQNCTYGGDLTPPSTIPTRTGYTFKGWRARQVPCSFASSMCGLSISTINGLVEDSSYGYISNDGQSIHNAGTYGLISPGTWAEEFTNGGIARGIASCNDIGSNTYDTAVAEFMNETMTLDQVINTVWGNCSSDAIQSGNTFNTGTTGQYCWCKMESYTPSGGSACNVTSPLWVFVIDLESSNSCVSNCGNYCAINIANTAHIRRALFGVSQ